jgi:hypothetical protein
MDERASAIRARIREGAVAMRIEIPPASDRA